jgi:sigma-B regulation protein RsbU (phosphoserine phosphatase)
LPNTEAVIASLEHRGIGLELIISALEGSATRIELGKSPLSLGRSADNDLAYPDDPWLSRAHLVFEDEDGIWRVKDCASRNGTILNAAALREPQRIKPGDRIYAGHLTIDVRDKPRATKQPVISFVAEPEEKATREATIVTSLDKLLGTDVLGETPIPNVHSSLSSARVVGALLKAGQELGGHRPLEALFGVILNLSLSAVDAKRGVILTLEDKNELVMRASQGEGFKIATAVRDRVIKGRTSLMIDDAQNDDAWRKQHTILRDRVRSMMAVPLQTGDRVIGLIYVDNGSVIKHFGSEDLDLLTVMANVAAIRIEHARLAEIEESEKLMELELAQASEIQQTFLPAGAPAYEGFDLAGLNLCCRTVGGDYYDFLPYQDGRMGLVVGDVSGKGTPAALLMSSLQARVQMLRETMAEPDQAVTTLNRNIAERCPLGKFITFFFGLLDPSGGFVYSNAGHNYPLLLRAGGEVEPLRGNGLVMGLFASVFYPLKSTRLEHGDLLALYSDGVTEAANAEGLEFGEDGLAKFLQQHQHLPCQEIVRLLVEEVREWHGSASFTDDFTVLLAKRH